MRQHERTEADPLCPPVRVVLVKTSHPGNIGAAARAMKCMGLGDLCLVNPSHFPSAEATARAAGADDVLVSARRVATLAEALADCSFVVATSARSRHLQWPMMTPSECAASVVHAEHSAPAALVFGSETAGLSNDELDHCNAVVRIPTSDRFASLNLAAAVQVLCYEVRLAQLARPEHDEPQRTQGSEPVTQAEMSGLYAHLEQMLMAVGYLDPDKPRLLRRRLRRFFSRAAPDRSELNIIRGILGAILSRLS